MTIYIQLPWSVSTNPHISVLSSPLLGAVKCRRLTLHSTIVTNKANTATNNGLGHKARTCVTTAYGVIRQRATGVCLPSWRIRTTSGFRLRSARVTASLTAQPATRANSQSIPAIRSKTIYHQTLLEYFSHDDDDKSPPASSGDDDDDA